MTLDVKGTITRKARAARMRGRLGGLVVAAVACASVALALQGGGVARADDTGRGPGANANQGFDRVVASNIASMTDQGRQTFRFDTFGD